MEDIQLQDDEEKEEEMVKDNDNLASCEEIVESEIYEKCMSSKEELKVEVTMDTTVDDVDDHLLKVAVEKLQVVETRNTELINETEEQRKVIEMLRREISKKDEEVMGSVDKFMSSENKYKVLMEDSNKKINELKLLFDQANKDKESMVIKYAMGEREILIERKGRSESEKKLKEAVKDKDSYQYKLKTLNNERTRLQGICDSRAQETIAAKKELDKWREDAKAAESKNILLNSKLAAEIEAHKQTKENLDRTFKELLDVQSSIDSIRNECSDAIIKTKQEEENLKHKEMIQDKEHSVKLMIDSAAAAELATLKKKYKETIDENNEMSVKVQKNESELQRYQSSMSQLKQTLTEQKTEIVDLYSKCAELESVKLQLGSETEKVMARDGEVSRLRGEAAELLADMAACRKKEGELLEFTQKLTDKNVTLQSEFSMMESKAREFESDHSEIVSDLREAQLKLAHVQRELDDVSLKRKMDTELLARKLAEKTKALEVANQEVIDSQNEIDVIKRQNLVRLKELSKELSSTKRQLESVERSEGGRESSPSLGSRCSSSSSLTRETGIDRTGENGEHASPVYTEKLEVPAGDAQQLLVEKIVKLQRACARRQEKLDILEEHIQQLMTEIKKKNRLIQHYFMNLETGTLATAQSDLHKATVGASHGIMASLYNSKVSDSGLTLELSLEINAKLQAVLEDTLLKNITLKENINTLGQEISKMALDKNGIKPKK